MGVPVVLFIPNLIGYTRILLGVAAFGFVRSPWVFVGLYMTSQGLDAVDGVCARACKQSEYAWHERHPGGVGRRPRGGRQQTLVNVRSPRSIALRRRPGHGH